MSSFEQLDAKIGSVPYPVVRQLSTIDVGRGSEALHRDTIPKVLESLSSRARVESITKSSEIEGVVVADRRREAAILEGASDDLTTRSEAELAGYRSALDFTYATRPKVAPDVLLEMHRLLMQYTAAPGGAYKEHPNLVVDRHDHGTEVMRFEPISPTATPYYVDELCRRFRAALEADRHHPVLLVGLFALDLLTIHPFSDGNGRVTRIATNALLLEAGYEVTRYVSLEGQIAQRSGEYLDTLGASTPGWRELEHDPWPWLTYFTSVLASSYTRFDELTAPAAGSGSKQDQVRVVVLTRVPEQFTIADVRTALPGVSDPTIRLALKSLRDWKLIEPESRGRNATWRRIVPGTQAG